MEKELKKKFEKMYGAGGDIRCCFAPGRVNLIGEHTDYNGGHVFPCALTIGTYGVARKREDRQIYFYSENFMEDGVIRTSLDELQPMDSAGWTNYPKGMIWALEQKGYTFPCGFEMLVYGDIPNGSGLSSSASLEVMTGLMLKVLYGLDDLTMQDIALTGQYSENHYNGMNCGIMDQFASAMGKKNSAIFLDTNTLNYAYVPVCLEDARIVITNSKVKHSLVGSAYNDRRRECETALKELQRVCSIETLGDLDETTFEKLKYEISSDICRKRAKHAVYENQRTIHAGIALKEGNLKEFGQLMNASHRSLRDDYEVSCEEIDILVEEAWKIPGVLGSRITGGGFGGCTVSIVKEDAVEEFQKKVAEAYKKRTGIEAEFYIVDIGDGAHVLG